MTFRQYEQDLLPLRGPWGQAWAAARGAQKDDELARARDAVLAGAITRCPSDALPRLGADAQIDLATGETEASFRARIGGAWESWSWVGTRYGITLSVGLIGYGYPSVWSYRELPPDTNATRWARVLVYFRGLPAWDAGAVWEGDDVWDSPHVADTIETADPLAARARLRPVLRLWINARDVCDRVAVTFGGLLWDVDAVWDGDDVWDAGTGEAVWQSPEWDTAEEGAVWDAPAMAWDAFC